MIDFSSETYQTILKRMLDRIPNTYDKRDTAPIPTALSPCAYALEGFYLLANQIQNGAFVSTASSTDLDELAILGGIQRQQASPAVRLGVFDAAVPLGARFSTPQGGNSVVFFVSTIPDPDVGINQYQLTAETAGAIGNQYFGALLPITAVQGLNSAILSDILVPGEDTETDEAFRQRLIDRLNEKPFAGNVASYRESILAIDGIGAVQVYPTWNGGGTVKCAILDATYLPASSTLVDTVQEAIDPTAVSGQGLGLAPIGASVTIVAAQPITVAISADITPETGYTVAQLQEPIETALESYFLSLRQAWSTPHGTGVSYSLTVYLSRILAAMVGVQGVANASSITLNGSGADLVLPENTTAQQVPILGTVTLNAV